jgi:hypothetical protein
VTTESSARAWADLFKRTSRRAEEVAAPIAPAREPDARITSTVFPHFLATLAHHAAPVLVDLGPVVGPNIAFFGERLSCKIHVEDILADIESHAQRGARGDLAVFLASRLRQEPGTIDGVLCWDVFDFLDRAAGRALAASLARVLRPGGALYGCFGTTPVELRHYTRTTVESERILRPRSYPATPVARTVLLTRDMIKMFDGLVVAESVLLKSSTRETLFRKP